MSARRNRVVDIGVDLTVRGFLRAVSLLPYRWRVPLVGAVTSRIVAPLAGWRGRIRANLDHVRPGLDRAERRRLVLAVPDNAGRALAEFYSAPEFVARLRSTPVEGPGLAAIERARDEGRPAIIVTGHFGNFAAPGIPLIARGFPIAGFYRPMRNPYFNRHYAAALGSLGVPTYPADRQGLAQLLRHLRRGGMVALLVDIYAQAAPPLDFLGRPAPTAVSAAELALRHRAPLVPMYGIRQPDGLSFRLVAEAPIPPSDPVTMTRALNESLGELVRRHPEQWFWIHRRWKPERQRARAAARIGP